VAEDPDHHIAQSLLLSSTSDLVSTDLVVVELLNLLTARRRRDVAVRLGSNFWSMRSCQLIWTTRADIEAARAAFSQFTDKQWSFTDCVSYAVMKRMRITEAFAIDRHFQQFGFAVVRP
jgi:predicted nucleic acid-binding protein